MAMKMTVGEWKSLLQWLSSIRPPSRLMTRSFLLLLFIFSYSLFTIFMLSRIQHQCPSAEELASELSRLTSPAPLSGKDFRLYGGRNETREEVEAMSKPLFWHDSQPIDTLLHRDFTPKTAFYIWCGKRWFEFPHYLSVKSVIKKLRPDTLIFFYNDYPVEDYWLYNTWFRELMQEYPFFRPHQLKGNEGSCLSNGDANLNFVKEQLSMNGGTYVQNLTILTNLPHDHQFYDLIDALDQGGHGFLMARKIAFTRIAGKVEQASGIRKKSLDCVHVRDFSMQNSKRVGCVFQTEQLFPKDIWSLNNTFGRLARSVFYGSEKVRQPLPSTDTLVPNIAHVVWLGGGYMDFLFYLCILSLLNVAKVEAVYLHGDGPPWGEYWQLIKDHQRLHLIHREHSGSVYGTPVKILSHVTDIWRVDFMIKYGGLYVDTDVIFVKPLDRRIRSYDAVATFDWTYWNHPFPDTINFGVSLGKRNAPYWHLFQDSMKWFIDADWAWNGLRRPYKVLERHPEKILIDPHFSVICFQSLCHPTWWPDYHNESVHHGNSASIKDWRNDVYAFHWTLPTPHELLNHSNLLSSRSMFAEIGQYVLEESNMLDYFKELSGK